jgi:hypothetical protein
MTDNSNSKLLRIVCKRAELMRAPYRVSSWTNKISQIDKNKKKQNKKLLFAIKSETKLNDKKICSSIQKVSA